MGVETESGLPHFDFGPESLSPIDIAYRPFRRTIYCSGNLAKIPHKSPRTEYSSQFVRIPPIPIGRFSRGFHAIAF